MPISQVSGGVAAATTPSKPAPAPAPAPAVPKAVEVAVPKVELAPLPKAEIRLDVEKLKAQLQEAISRMNEAVKDGGRGLSFSMDSAVGGPVVVVKNVSTGEVIRQIPNAEAVKTAHDIERFRSVFINKLV